MGAYWYCESLTVMNSWSNTASASKSGALLPTRRPELLHAAATLRGATCWRCGARSCAKARRVVGVRASIAETSKQALNEIAKPLLWCANVRQRVKRSNCSEVADARSNRVRHGEQVATSTSGAAIAPSEALDRIRKCAGQSCCTLCSHRRASQAILASHTWIVLGA